MSNSFGYLDIILLGMIAGFIILRLRSILGRKTGHESKVYPGFAEKEFNIPKNDIKDSKQSLNDKVNITVSDKTMSSNVVDIKDTKKLVSAMAQSAPIDVDKVAKIKEAISTGKYPLDLDKLSDALMQAYREMKS